VGRFVEIKFAGYDFWTSALPPRTGLFRKWHKHSNSVHVDEVNGVVSPVNCGDRLSIQVGCKGESTLAWKQVLEVK